MCINTRPCPARLPTRAEAALWGPRASSGRAHDSVVHGRGRDSGVDRPRYGGPALFVHCSFAPTRTNDWRSRDLIGGAADRQQKASRLAAGRAAAGRSPRELSGTLGYSSESRRCGTQGTLVTPRQHAGGETTSGRSGRNWERAGGLTRAWDAHPNSPTL